MEHAHTFVPQMDTDQFGNGYSICECGKTKLFSEGKVYRHEDTGSLYRINGEEVEFYALSKGNQVIDQASCEWGAVDYDLVGTELVDHEGSRITVNELGRIIRRVLN